MALIWCVAMLATGCGHLTTPPEPDLQYTVAAGDTATMRPDETACLQDGAVSIQFGGVLQDSRCPIDVTCLWRS